MSSLSEEGGEKKDFFFSQGQSHTKKYDGASVLKRKSAGISRG
jgi:hypothetical protein